MTGDPCSELGKGEREKELLTCSVWTLECAGIYYLVHHQGSLMKWVHMHRGEIFTMVTGRREGTGVPPQEQLGY